MAILKELETAYIVAFKQKKEPDLGVIRMLKAALKNKEIALRGLQGDKKLSEEEVIALFRSEIKKRKEAAEAFKEGGRQELVDKELAEVKVIEAFLPAEMSADDVEAKVKTVIDNLPEEQKENFGLAMKAVMQELKGAADGKIVSEAVRKLLK